MLIAKINKRRLAPIFYARESFRLDLLIYTNKTDYFGFNLKLHFPIKRECTFNYSKGFPYTTKEVSEIIVHRYTDNWNAPKVNATITDVSYAYN